MKGVNIHSKLRERREKKDEGAEKILLEANRILNNDLYNKKNVLSNLRGYQELVEVIDEEDVERERVFTLEQIREVALEYRLRFLNSKNYRFEFPYDVVFRIDYLNDKFKKNLKGFKILGTTKFFKVPGNTDGAILFAPTNHGNYYLVHQWGTPLKWNRKYLSWALKNFENLFLTIILATLIIALSIPTYHITLDRTATYWCGYRVGVFFHLLIFNMGVTAYVTFAFAKNLGTGMWDKERDFG